MRMGVMSARGGRVATPLPLALELCPNQQVHPEPEPSPEQSRYEGHYRRKQFGVWPGCPRNRGDRRGPSDAEAHRDAEQQVLRPLST